MNIIKEAQKQEPIHSSRLASLMQFRNFPQESPDSQLLQSFIRSSIQRESGPNESASMPSNTGRGNNPSGSQESSFNYIFNLLLNSVSNNEDGNPPNPDSFMNLNQSFGGQGNGPNSNQDMHDN